MSWQQTVFPYDKQLITCVTKYHSELYGHRTTQTEIPCHPQTHIQQSHHQPVTMTVEAETIKNPFNTEKNTE